VNSKSPSPAGEYDLVVIGSGVGGLATALAAVESGMSVAVLEKDKMIGGGTCLSYGGLWAGCNHIAKGQGIEDSPEAVMEYMRFVAGDQADEEHMRAYVESAPVALEAFERLGVEIQLLPGFTDHYYPVAPGSTEVGRSLQAAPTSLKDLGEYGDKIRDSHIDPHRISVSEIIAWGGLVNRRHHDQAVTAKREKDKVRTGGAALIAHFVRALLARDTVPFLEVGAERLLYENGEVAGVVTNTGQQVRARRGVVLATGGWEGDTEITKNFEGLPGWHSPFPKAVSGDGYHLATGAGAATALIRNNLAVMVGLPVPPPTKDGETEFRLVQINECLMPHIIIVNAHGERFSDETYFQDTAAAIRDFDVWKREFRNLPCYLLFDSQYVENFSFCGSDVGTPPPDWVDRADTLEGLAGKLGISKDGLRTGVERFNEFARDGVDLDFHRGEKKWRLANLEGFSDGTNHNPSLGPLEKGPFYGVQLAPAAFVPSGGVRTDCNANVIDTWGEPIAKLFAVGNTAAHLEYGVGYQAGYSLTAAMTFAYRCVEHLQHQ